MKQVEKSSKNDNVLPFKKNEQKQFIEVVKNVSIPFVPVGLIISEEITEFTSFHKLFLLELLQLTQWDIEPGESLELGNEHEFFDIQFQREYELEPNIIIYGLRIFLPFQDIIKLDLIR